MNIGNRAVRTKIQGGPRFWVDDELKKVLPDIHEDDDSMGLDPIHEKFLGDGSLMIWTPRPGEVEFAGKFVSNMSVELWNLKNQFDAVVRYASWQVPLVEIPQKIRFGIAAGPVYGLKSVQGTEFIGYSINLASRLQGYCPDLGFIVSSRLGLTREQVEKHGWTRVKALKLKNFPDEVVYVDTDEWASLKQSIKDDLFSTTVVR